MTHFEIITQTSKTAEQVCAVVDEYAKSGSAHCLIDGRISVVLTAGKLPPSREDAAKIVEEALQDAFLLWGGVPGGGMAG